MEQFQLLKSEPKKSSKPNHPKEWKLVALRDCPLPDHMLMCDTPDRAAEYWRLHITTTPHYDPERECFVVLILNTRRRVRGHHFVSIGTMDTILVHAREVFRIAIAAGGAAIVMMHNLCAAAHKLCYVECPFMCSRPSDALKPTRVLCRKERCANK